MLRVLLGLVCFLLVLPTTSLASDSLIRDMEIEIAIQSLSERVFKESRKKAWAAVKKNESLAQRGGAERSYGAQVQRVSARHKRSY